MERAQRHPRREEIDANAAAIDLRLAESETRQLTASLQPEEAEPFAQLQKQYADRLAAAHEFKRGGGQVVGLVGNLVPPELVLAMDGFPLLVAGELGHQTPHADEYMEEHYEWEFRSIFERVLNGTYEFLDLLVISRPYFQLYYFLKEVYRQGLGPNIPPLHMFDLAQSQRPSLRQYGLGQFDDLIARLERLGGAGIDDDQLRAAIETTNRKRQLVRRLLEKRRAGGVSGTQAMQAIGAGYFMDPRRYCQVLSAYLDQLEPEAKLTERPRLLVLSTEPLYHLMLHQTLEDAGSVVIDEDDWWGSRAAGEDIPQTSAPRQAIFDHYFSKTATSRVYPRQARERWFRERAVKPDVDSVIFYVPPSDRMFGWDYPRLKAFLEGHGKASVLLRDDVLTEAGRQNVLAVLKTSLVGLRSTAGR